MPTTFCTSWGPESVPATVNAVPSASTARSWTTLRWLGLSVAVVRSTVTPRSSARAGALTKVTWSSTTAENTPRSAASCSTVTSSAASSPRTSTVMDEGNPPATAPSRTPSLRTSSSQGPTSSPTTPPAWTFTASGTKSPASASSTLFATSVPARSWASVVEAPRCGVTTALGWSNSGESVLGSVAYTSMPAAPT